MGFKPILPKLSMVNKVVSLAKKPGQVGDSGTFLGHEIFSLYTGFFALAIFLPACLGAGGGVKNR